jgi:sec-independent protein translocase protein TatB
MFDIGWSELLVIGVVALIAIGPKELPTVLRTVGQWMGKIRRMAAEFQGQFQEAMREAEMAELKKQVDEMTSAATDFANFDPLAESQKDTPHPLEPPTETTTAPPPELAAPDVTSPSDAGSPQGDALSAAPQAPQPKSGEGA